MFGKGEFFIWCMLYGTIPCCVTLANTHMKVSPQCPAFCSDLEDTKHVLFLCYKAREVWRRLGLNEIIMRACEIDRVGEAVLEFLLLMPEQDLTSVATMNVREMIAITTWHL